MRRQFAWFVCLIYIICCLQLRRASRGNFPAKMAAASQKIGVVIGTTIAVTNQTSLCGAVSHCFFKILIPR